MGVEPTSYPWEGYILPMYYTRAILQIICDPSGIRTRDLLDENQIS